MKVEGSESSESKFHWTRIGLRGVALGASVAVLLRRWSSHGSGSRGYEVVDRPLGIKDHIYTGLGKLKSFAVFAIAIDLEVCTL